MAIIKTDSTRDITSALAEQIFNALEAPEEAAERAAYLLGRMSLIAPAKSGSGVEYDGTYLWETAIGSSTAQSIETYKNYDWNPSAYYSWLENSTSKYSFTGSDIDGVGGKVTSLSFSGNSSMQQSTAGYIGNWSWQNRCVADIDHELSSSTLVVTRADYSLVSSGYESGYSGELDGTVIRRSYSGSESFEGHAVFNMGSWTSTLTSSTLYAYSQVYKSQVKEEGSYTERPGFESQSFTFKFKSALGLTASTNTISGAIDSILYSSVRASSGDYDAVTKSVDYFQYANGTAMAGGINIQLLQNLYNNPSVLNYGAWESELLKGDDVILVTSAEASNIKAGAGNDKVTGGKGNDYIDGGDGDDVVNGGNGQDTLYGSFGNDILKGGGDDDLLSGQDGNDDLDGGSGNDLLYGGAGNDRMLGGLGNDTLAGEGDDDYLDGGAGNDWLNGSLGNDTLKGGAGNDYISGGSGDDIIDGGAGSDWIMGGFGRDLMTGGTGLDGFHFAAGESGDVQLTQASLDQISGFNVAQDQILLNCVFSEADITVLSTAQSYADLLTAAKAANKYVVVGFDSANTYVFADIDQNGTLDTAVQLVGIKGIAVANALSIESVVLGP